MIITPVLLVICLVLIAAGTITAGILARKNNKLAIEFVISLLTLITLVWLAVGFGLSAKVTLVKLALSSMEISWSLFIDAFSWRASLLVLIMAQVLLLIQWPRFSEANPGDDRGGREWLAPSSHMLMVFTTLLAILSDSFFGLILSWSGVTLSWLVFQWISIQQTLRTRQILGNGSPLLLAIALLAVTGLAGQDVSNITGDSGILPSSALIWGTLAGLTMLVGVPLFIIIFPSERQISQLNTVVTALLPCTAGGFLLARLATFEYSSTLFLLTMTGLGLIGFLLAVYLAVMRSGDIKQAAPLLLIAGMSYLVLITLWSDPAAVVAQISVLSLGIGAFFLLKDNIIITDWASIIPAGAVAGMPLTLGFASMIGLYHSWLNLELYPLVLVTTLINSLFIATFVLTLRPKKSRQVETKPHSQPRLITLFAVILIFLGLFDLPQLDIEGVHILAWIAIFVSTAVGILAAWYIESKKVALNELRGIFRINSPLLFSRNRLKGFHSSYRIVIKEIVAILEGEGGMLWVLVLVIILWLARQG